MLPSLLPGGNGDVPLAPAPPAVDTPLISVYAITGITTANTIHLRVTIGAHSFTALIDSGSTHNLMSVEAAKRAGLHFHDTTRS